MNKKIATLTSWTEEYATRSVQKLLMAIRTHFLDRRMVTISVLEVDGCDQSHHLLVRIYMDH